MSSDRSDRAAFLKTAGLSLLALPAFGGMAPRIVSPRGIGINVISDHNRNIPEKLARIPDLSTLAGYVMGNSSLYALLEGAGPYTVFAPSNEAFAALPAGTLNRFSKDPAYLQAIIERNIINGAYKRKMLVTGTYTPLAGPSFRILQEEAETHVAHGIILRPNIGAANGFIQLTSKVLLWNPGV
ncbi:MAG: fasciclin domain-containing protein [Candidatus Eremiobacteraeota bacterium]|nr:fasciclin domain-containing protein [Candidatus Eremiobacteraeota bacterium]